MTRTIFRREHLPQIVDRAGWPAGPWDDEPDIVEWRSSELPTVPLLAIRNNLGCWCGYAAVARGHKAHGLDWGHPQLGDVRVHGGLTFAGAASGLMELSALPEPPDPPGFWWWFGFDCGHGFDVMPAMEPMLARVRSKHSELSALAERMEAAATPRVRRLLDIMRSQYRDLEYVMSEAESLGAQLLAMKGDARA